MMSVTCVLCVSLLIVCYHYISAAGIGSTCTSNTGCTAVANAVCKNTICTCPENFVPSTSNNKCIRSLKHNQDCEESVQCNYSHEMECKDNKCQCKANFKYDGVQCLGSLGLGKKCERDSECFDSSDPKQKTVWCYNQLCACRSGFTGEGARCVIGGDCVADSDCNHIENSTCKKTLHDRYRCTCQDKYLAAANNTKCLPTVRHNEICEEPLQCTYSNETECQDSKCQCRTNAEYKEGQCVLRKVGIGSACTKSDDCNGVNDAACVNQVCACLDSHVPNPTNQRNCLPKAKHDQTCSESIQCSYSAEAECVFSQCQCKSNFNYNGELCVGNIGLGQPCERDSECVVPYDLKQETVWCRGSQCACKQGFRREGDRCVIGGDCITNDDCKDLGNSHCDTRVRDRYHCACNEDYLPAGNNTKCFPIANQIGSGCEYDEQCSHKLGKAVCRDNQCRCVEGTSLRDDSTCVIGGECSTDADCSQLDNTYCDTRVQGRYQCTCKNDFIRVGNDTKCLPIASHIGSGCEYDEQCSHKLGKAVCRDNQCRCAEGTSSKDGNTCGAAVRVVLSLSSLMLIWAVKLL